MVTEESADGLETKGVEGGCTIRVVASSTFVYRERICKFEVMPSCVEVLDNVQ